MANMAASFDHLLAAKLSGASFGQRPAAAPDRLAKSSAV